MKYSTDRKARVLIVDDHSIVREGMAMLINRESDMHACCEAEQIEQALEANRNCPHDIAIIDMTLEGYTGLELIRRLLIAFPDLPILMLSMHDESIYAGPALKAGARGYLMKQTASGELLLAIRQILSGSLYVSDKIRTRMFKKISGEPVNNSPLNTLSECELEVLHLVGIGLGTSEIAKKISRSVKTVESHKANIKKKLDLENSSQLIKYAVNFVSFNNL